MSKFKIDKWTVFKLRYQHRSHDLAGRYNNPATYVVQGITIIYITTLTAITSSFLFINTSLKHI